MFRVKGEFGENEEAVPSTTSNFSVHQIALPRPDPKQSLIYLKVLCVAPCKSQVAPDFCFQTDYLTPPKGVSTIPSQEITVYLWALGSLPSSSVVTNLGV